MIGRHPNSPNPPLPAGVRLAPSATKLDADMQGAVVVCGSHGGLYPGYLAARARVRAVILCDAGVGRDGAGIAALTYLEGLAIPAAAVSSRTCRIGDAEDMAARGMISFANQSAVALGVAAGMPALEAAALMSRAKIVRCPSPKPVGEGRTVIDGPCRAIVLIDSAALVRPEDVGAVIVTGSHGGLVGGASDMALQVDAFAAGFNDAGVGAEEAGIARLPALDRRAIAAFTVAASSARIGDARSTFEDGIVSRVNDRAGRLGGTVGMPARALVERLARL